MISRANEHAQAQDAIVKVVTVKCTELHMHIAYLAKQQQKYFAQAIADVEARVAFAFERFLQVSAHEAEKLHDAERVLAERIN